MKQRRRTQEILAPEQYLSREQVQQLQDYVSQNGADPQRYQYRAAVNKLIVDVLLNTGLRASEFCALEMRDLPHCHGKDVINVRSGKGCKQRSVVINSKLAERIRAFIKRRRPRSKLRSPLVLNEDRGRLSYRSLYSKVKVIGQRIGIEYLHPHLLRHTFAVWLYDQENDPIFVKNQLGHSSLDTTMIYVRTVEHTIRKKIENFSL